MPQKSVAPVVMAASAVMRLQTVVSREVPMTDSAVVTVGTVSAGMNENVIPDRALLRLNVRTFKDQLPTRVLAAIKRILEAEAAASGAPKPPEFSMLSEFPLTRNDEAATRKAVAASPTPVWRRSGDGDRSGHGKRGLWAVPRGLGCTDRFLGDRRDRSSRLRKCSKGRQAGRASGQSCSRLRSGASSHFADRRRSDAGCSRRLDLLAHHERSLIVTAPRGALGLSHA